jgi:hypothetical protein
VSSSKAELLMQRRQTLAYLKANPAEIVLMRQTPVKTAAGGRKKGASVALDPQMFRLEPFKRRLSHTQSQIVEGTVTLTSYVLVGRWDADVQRGDEFVYGGGRYKVESVEPERSFRTAADVTYTGVADA